MLKQCLSRGVVLVGLLVLLTIASAAVSAQEESLPTISATAEGITVPEGLVAGLTTIVFQNDTEAPFAPFLARFNEGKTLPDLMSAMQVGGFNPVFEVVTILGNPDTPPGESYQVTYDLLAGDYVLLSFGDFRGGPPTILPFSVAEIETEAEATPELLVADVTVQLADFMFAMPTEIEAGAQLWQIENVGEQAHHMVIFAVENDVTLEDVTAAISDALMNATTFPAPMPYETVFGWGIMSPAQSAYIELDLEPGKYVFVCFLPDQTAEDPEQAMTHFAHGMIKLVTMDE